MTEPLARVEPDWLALRVAADSAARAVTESTLLPRLAAALGLPFGESRPRPAAPLEVIDVGAGTGANQRWLRPRLSLPQHWTHLDHDESIIDHDRLAETAYLVGPVSLLPQLITTGPTLITCSALLDVLSIADLQTLIDSVTAAGAPALFSLSVTGEVLLSPGDPLDELISSRFDDHQRRGGRSGPEAPALAATEFRRAGYAVSAVPTPWLLGPESEPAFVDRYLTERVAAAVELDPDLARPATGWLSRRRTELAAGKLSVRVEHVDLLALPFPRQQWRTSSVVLDRRSTPFGAVTLAHSPGH